MTKSEIEAFLAAVEYGSLSAAAEQIYVTQPALSRRIQNLEAELGYTLFRREKGMRSISLTAEGQAFLSVAQKWNTVYQEAQAIRTMDQKPVLRLAAIGSITAYVLPRILPEIAAADCPYLLDYHSCHSREGHSLVESGFSDLVLIDHLRKAESRARGAVISTPVYSVPFILIGGRAWKGLETVHPSQLDPRKEIRLPWNSAFDLWHEHWFDASVHPQIRLDLAMVIKDVLRDDLFSIVPKNVGDRLAEESPDFALCRIDDGPPDEMIHALTSVTGRHRPEVIHFFSLLKRELQGMEDIQCYL